MTLFHALVLSIVEGLTEFLPISSTGHMVLVSHFMHMEENAALQTFEIVSQLGAIMAVVVLYFDHLLKLPTIKKLIVGFIPTGIVGLLIYPHIKSLLDSPLVVASTMLIGGILILGVETWYEKERAHHRISSTTEISYKQALFLGLFQSLAVIPGLSRSGSMIVGGLTMRLPRALLTEFTFLLAVPTMLMASLYTLHKKWHELSFADTLPIGIGTLLSFIIALIVIRYFLSYIRKHSFKVFGWYRIVLGIILLIILL